MKNILKKCIEELVKPEPKLDYIRGMLEVLVEQESTDVAPVSFKPVPLNKPNVAANPHGLPSNDAFKVLSDNPIENG